MFEERGGKIGKVYFQSVETSSGAKGLGRGHMGKKCLATKKKTDIRKKSIV